MTHARPVTLRHARVLLVDDNEDAANTTADLLRLYGHDVTVAHTATGALSGHDPGAFDTYVLDIGLPDLSGYDLATRLRAACAGDALFIAATGYGQAEDRARSHAAGFDHHLVKPLDPERLLELVGGAVPGGQID
ncbi:response regulator [Cognatilysobacter bugurensis]|uniref:response regulator n=1 Tax=Cognatilysobacter bugurensis TaxID=543356 RepID=UPI001E605605|nr:response regulator [Lysobacter bugurensis]